jgi:DNA-binding response OmpR family regulator|tara:strand:+ start:816 stop:1088 length:273 start_codon:yes stop_codon:yes gene_type:complete
MDLVHYTKTERKYMCALLSTPGFITKEAIHHHIYRHDPEGGPNDKIIDVFLCKVRRKLREANSRFFIITHWGYGIGLAMGVSPPYELDLV